MSDTTYAPWQDDPDPPEEDLTEEQLQKLVEGVRELLGYEKKPEEKK